MGSLGVTLFGANTGMPLAPFSAIDPVASPFWVSVSIYPSPTCQQCHKGAGLEQITFRWGHLNVWRCSKNYDVERIA